MEKQCNGLCPKCLNDDIEWNASGYFSGKYYVIGGLCLDCDLFFEEFHTLTYIKTKSIGK